jgi:16S rRNA (guanine966-N2)-methyltransferase
MAKRNRKQESNISEPLAGLRIIGGHLRARNPLYSGALRPRPMKDRPREAIFNLIGPAIRGKHAIDLFAGTGALALEAISRGADRATLIEQHHPTAAIIRQNIAALQLESKAEVVPGNTFIWWKKTALQHRCHAHACRGHEDKSASLTHQSPLNMPTTSVGMAPSTISDNPWVVFCSPPYDFYVSRIEEMLELIAGMIQSAPVESIFAVEADERFDFQTLPNPQAWDVRSYPPAVVGIFQKEFGHK